MGEGHARSLARLAEVELIGVAAVNGDPAQAVARRVGTRAYSNHRHLLPHIDAAVIAVPTTHPYSVALDFLNQSTPILVEKPLALNLAQADEMVDLAKSRRTIIQVGHIERFNPAFLDLSNRPIQPKLILSERMGPFTGRSTDIGVVLDLMIHDLDIMLALVQSPVQTVQSTGLTLFGKMEDVAHARLSFANGCLGTVTSSRASPVAQRRMQIWGLEGYA